ncbi:MAG TPA: heavy metal translocating P-type ATPase [Usitatibacter sp.]|nr:heavy metal translocating P-type ATPase [Usitatibacter sp.]
MQECFHCGLPVPAGAGFGFSASGTWRAFCCPGCEAISRSITGLGLDDYYRLRDQPAPTPAADSGGDDLAAFDDPLVQSRFVTDAPEGAREAQLLLEGLRCAACAWLVEQALARIDGVLELRVNFASRRARLRWDPRRVALSAVLRAVRALGYAAWPHEEGRLASIEARERRSLLRRLWVAGLGMMQVMMYAVPTYLAGDGEIGADAQSLMRWAGLLLTLPVIVYSASPFFAGALRDLRVRSLGMDVPVALGLVAAFAASVAATLAGRGEVYFDSVTMFVFLLTGGRYLEFLARCRAGDALQYLSRLVPQTAHLLPAGGDEPSSVAVARLVPGDRVLVRSGETVPADGDLECAEAIVNEAWLSGESRPLVRHRGERVLGGSVNAGSALILVVRRVGADTAISAIHRMMERALDERPRWVETAQRTSGLFVGLVLACAALGGIAWAWIDPARALWIAVSVLIVTCPCAFALATPAAVTVATGALARRNLVASRGHAIEALASATDFVFDKTGTLTYGRPRLLQTRAYGEATPAGALAVAAAIARWSSHPLDRALVMAAGDPDGVAVARHETHAGSGLEAEIDGRRVRLGRADFVAALHGRPVPLHWLDSTDSIVWLGDERGWIAAFRLGDELRPEAAAAIEALRSLGVVVHLLSGDERPVAERVARELGIGRVTGRALPEMKQRYVRDLQLAGARVAMVGDGINDAPVLAQADVSVAMGGGADIAQLRADAVLLSDSLADLVAAVRTCRRTRRVIAQNVAWALAYNAVVIPLAFLGWVTPLVAGIGMSASSLLVVANALRLKA